jgi:murein L,D-transpeptidase YafK
VRRAELLRAGIRHGQRCAVVAFAFGAAALADGTTAGSLGIPPFANESEGELVRTIVGLREMGLQHAIEQIDKLLARNPNYRLGYLIKGDLLMARAGQPVAFAASAAATAASVASIAPLQDEARARVQRYVDGPRVDYLPEPLLQLAPSQPYALLVDTSRSRMFVYANDLGRPRYVTDFYISLGKNGIDKTREGDQKTPIGVYTVVSQKDKLPDFYGTNAYPLSYPNEWDRLNGRNGHGIWLHGTPSATYSRPPRDTDGCVVLTNEDLARLSRYVDVAHTPVVIGEAIEWRAPNQWENERESILSAFEKWRTDWESRDNARYLSNYSRKFRSESRDFASWSAKKKHVNSGKAWIRIGVKDMSLFAYPGSASLMMITFEQDYRSNNMSRRTLKRQFWSREDGRWRIVHETVVS